MYVMCSRCGDYREAFRDNCPTCDEMADDDAAMGFHETPTATHREMPVEFERMPKIIMVASGSDEPNPYKPGTIQWRAWEYGQKRDHDRPPPPEPEYGMQYGPYQMEFFDLGYYAYIRGDMDNPMIPGTPEARGWEDGWRQAYAEVGGISMTSGADSAQYTRENLGRARTLYEEDPNMRWGDVFVAEMDIHGDSDRARRTVGAYGDMQRDRRVNIEYMNTVQELERSLPEPRLFGSQEEYMVWHSENEPGIRIVIANEPEPDLSMEEMLENGDFAKDRFNIAIENEGWYDTGLTGAALGQGSGPIPYDPDLDVDPTEPNTGNPPNVVWPNYFTDQQGIFWTQHEHQSRLPDYVTYVDPESVPVNITAEEYEENEYSITVYEQDEIADIEVDLDVEPNDPWLRETGAEFNILITKAEGGTASNFRIRGLKDDVYRYLTTRHGWTPDEVAEVYPEAIA